MKDQITDLEKAVDAGELSVDLYLSDVTIKEFIADVIAMKKRYTDKAAIAEAIKRLQELL